MTTIQKLIAENLKLKAELKEAYAAAAEYVGIARPWMEKREKVIKSLQAQLDIQDQERQSLNRRLNDSIHSYNILSNEHWGLQTEADRLAAANEVLESNLSAFRDRFKARVSELNMESRFWRLDIKNLLDI